MIALKNVTKSYGGAPILSGAALRIDPGSCMCIIGESGSGKSTLMRLLIRAEDPDGGSVDIDGVNIRTLPPDILQLYRRRVGVIFQQSVLLDHLTVEENLHLPLELFAAPNTLIKRNSADLLKRLGLLKKAASFPRELSPGEQSLLCIARAMITAPMVLLADEPLHDLDAVQSKTVIELLHNMHKKGTTIVLFSRSAALGHALHAEIVHLQSGKLSKEAHATTHAKPMDAHRILEEDKDQETSEISHSVDADDQDVPPVSTDHKQSGRRIRITSIGSNS